MSATHFFLPDILADYPWPRHLNPHYDVVAPESSRWTESFQAFSPKAQKSFNRCDIGRLALLAYPLHDKARARTGCDLMNLFFIIDEHSDVEGEHVVREMADIVMDALRNPYKPRPSGEWVGGEATRQFWELAIKTASPTSQRRFVQTFGHYLDAVVQQAEDRTRQHIRGLDSYLEVRRDTIGSKPSFAMLELEMELPDDVFNHPILENLRLWVTDMLCIGNDIYSYNVEQARGDDLHNMVTVIMRERDVDVQGAMDYIGVLHDRLVKSFLLAKDRLPSWGEPIDSQVARYVDGLGNWVRANYQWSFESQRYFGTKGLDIMRHRKVEMLPKLRTTNGIVINIPSEEPKSLDIDRSSFIAEKTNLTGVGFGKPPPQSLPRKKVIGVVILIVYLIVTLSYFMQLYGYVSFLSG